MKGKKRIVALGLILCMLLSFVPAAGVYADQTVYITKSGSKYHTTSSCKGLNRAKSVTPTSLSNAIARGYTACAICAGGTAGSSSSSGSSSSGSSSGGSSASVTPSPALTPVTPATIPASDTISANSSQVNMFRMYNPNSGEHFYTASSVEGNSLLAVGWVYEGVAWVAPVSSNTPVYRLCNPCSGEHHYTTNGYEADVLSANGWNHEGIGWYSTDEATVPLYRLFNPNAKGKYEAGAHHYTTSMTEVNALTDSGWQYEGIGWYGY